MLKKWLWVAALAGCTTDSHSHPCTDAAYCINGVSLLGDWFGGLPDDTMLDNDGMRLGTEGWTSLKAIEITGGPEDNSRLDPDESYCATESPSNFSLMGNVIQGSPAHGTVIKLTDHELDVSIDALHGAVFFRIDPPRLAPSCNP